MESMSWSFWSPAKGSSPSEQGEKSRQEKSEYWRTVLKHLKDATQQEKKICVNPTDSSCTARVRQREIPGWEALPGIPGDLGQLLSAKCHSDTGAEGVVVPLEQKHSRDFGQV